MKIKHFQGYGCVNAKVVKKVTDTSTHCDGYITKTLVIRVWGNHEYGLVRNDIYDINNWLVKKVAKVDIDYKQITTLLYEYIDDIDNQEAIEYTIKYREKW